MRKIWEHNRVFVRDVQDIPIYEYACGSSQAMWDPLASLFVSLRSSIVQRSSVDLRRCTRQFLGVCRPHCRHLKASVSFYEADNPIGVVNFHGHLFIGLNFLVKNTPISCSLLYDTVGCS